MKKRFSGILPLIFLFLAFSCASHKVGKEKEQDDITKEDFKITPLKIYDRNKDYFDVEVDEEKRALAFENAWIVDASVVQDDPLFEIQKGCFESGPESSQKLIRYHYAAYKKNPSYWNSIGLCHLVEKNYLKAMIYFNKAIALERKYAPALNNLGVLYSMTGKTQKSLVAFKQARRSAANASIPQYNLALLYIRYGLNTHAKKIVDYLTHRFPRDEKIMQLAKLLNKDQ